MSRIRRTKSHLWTRSYYAGTVGFMSHETVKKYINNQKRHLGELKYHIVWCTKYRRKVLIPEVEKRLKELILEKSETNKYKVLELEIMPDHVHLFIQGSQKDSVRRIVSQLKGYTSHVLRKEFPFLNSRLPTKRKSPKRKTVTQLKKDLDKVFSWYTRLSETDENLIGHCITCKKQEIYKNLQCGHFMSRQYMSTRWCEINTACQCCGCNVMNQGRQFIFGVEIDKTHGEGTAQKLYEQSREIRKFSVGELKEMIQDYTEKCKELLKTKKNPPELKFPKV